MTLEKKNKFIRPKYSLELLLKWVQNGRRSRQVSIMLIFLAVILGFLTFGLLGGISVFGIQPGYLLLILGADIIVFLLLGILISKKLVELWIERKQGLAGSKLHVRLTILFGALAITPAIIMTLFSITFFHFGLQDWFSTKVQSALSESVAVAKSYLQEHQTLVTKDASLMAYDLNRELPHLLKNKEEFDHYLTVMSSLRSLTEAIVFDQQQNLLGRSSLTFALQFEPIPEWALELADTGKVALLNSEYHDRVRALVRLPGFRGIYLFVGRAVDANVLSHLKKSEEIFKEYGILEGKRTGFEVMAIALFFVVALLLLLVAIWLGLIIAGQFAKPIKDLITAAERIGSGDLSSRVQEGDKRDELSLLSSSFNQMAQKIDSQQSELIYINKELEERRRFIESTLAGVSAGVIGLDPKGDIRYFNQISSDLLGIDLQKKQGKKLSSVIPELSDILKKAAHSKNSMSAQQISLERTYVKTFVVHVVVEREKESIMGYVVTFDEITGLIAAQKQAAWSDVARHLAHEIKNPLTPIHLSAERLKRKYLKEIKTSPKVFLDCIDTIIRQVTYLGHMVSEFSAFSRMPAAVMGTYNIVEICEQALFLQKNSFPTIHYNFKMNKPVILLKCDEQQVAQTLLNLLKNAAEAILESTKIKIEKPQILLSLKELSSEIVIEIRDNGPGFPKNFGENLIDPYVTTRSKGTGLGLAIVQRIMEEHGGTLELSNRTGEKGATVRLIFLKNI